jgi:hypothetical protein
LGKNWPGGGGGLYTGERPQGHHGPLVLLSLFVNSYLPIQLNLTFKSNTSSNVASMQQLRSSAQNKCHITDTLPTITFSI